MRRFGTVDSFVETAEGSLKLGRLVANFEFLKALLRYGTFDEYQFFCPSLEAKRLLQDRLADALDKEELKRVVLSHHLDLLEAIAERAFSAFHLGDWHLYLPKLARLRARHAAHPLPLSGPIHSLDGVGTLAHVAELLRAPLRPGDTVVCTSQEGRQVFRNLLAAVRSVENLPPEIHDPSLEVIPLGVPIQAFERGDRAAGRELLGLAADAVCFLYLGRISITTKGDLGPLLYAFRVLIETHGNCTLVLAGSGSQTEWANLLTQIRDLGLTGKVDLRAAVDDREKVLLLAAADVFLSPVDSLQETFGISVVEAMAAGLPVIASDFDGYRDLVVEGETGFRIPTLWGRPPERILELGPILDYRLTALALGQSFVVDLGHLLDRMTLLAGDHSLRERLGEAGHRRARERFAWDRIIPRYEILWAEAEDEARRTWPGAPGPPKPQDASLFDLFQAYPTHLLGPGDRLALTGVAQAILNGVLPMPPYYEELTALTPLDQLRVIVEELTPGPRPWGEGRVALAEKTGLPGELLDFLVLWMLKRGLLSRLPEK